MLTHKDAQAHFTPSSFMPILSSRILLYTTHCAGDAVGQSPKSVHLGRSNSNRVDVFTEEKDGQQAEKRCDQKQKSSAQATPETDAPEWPWEGAITDYSDAAITQLVESIRLNASKLPKRPRPVLPLLGVDIAVHERVKQWQSFITSFEYDHTGRPRIERRRDGGLQSVCRTGGEIVAAGLPIQCVEAVFLAIMLTTGAEELRRLPLSFKTTVDGHTFRHIVLALEYGGKWGSMGISRREDLMDKEMRFESLSELVTEYRTCYQRCHHEMTTVYVGMPMAHSSQSTQPIKWRLLMLDMGREDWATIVDKYVESIPAITEFYIRTKRYPERVAEVLICAGEPRFRLSTSRRRSRTQTCGSSSSPISATAAETSMEPESKAESTVSQGSTRTRTIKGVTHRRSSVSCESEKSPCQAGGKKANTLRTLVKRLRPPLYKAASIANVRGGRTVLAV